MSLGTALSGARARRRLTVPPLLAAVLLAAACGGRETADDAAVPDAGAVADAADPAAAPPPAPGTPWTAEDSARAVRDDSIYEARLLRTRQAGMDSYEGCMAKTKGADPEQRVILEAACRRGREATAEPPRR